ncbi:concanavalin A-like lectin/glucanase [Ramicandelaber brevisporus]|nr:concanavalin A-like lectin/glucanase [Ramicandelaber brevisporus]
MRSSLVSLAAVATLAIFSQTGYAAAGDNICPHQLGPCPKEKPCCDADGFCSDSKKACMAGYCQPKASFSPDSCQKKPACHDATYTFSKKTRIVEAFYWDGDPNSADIVVEYSPQNVKVRDNKLVLRLSPPGKDSKTGQGYGTSISLPRWLNYGIVKFRMKSASKTGGVVTSFNVRGKEGDELDIEITNDVTRYQANTFFDGIEEFGVNMRESPKVENGTLATDFHDYSIDWTPERAIWGLDGNQFYTLTKESTFNATTGQHKYPYRTGRIQFGVWDGGAGPQGTRDWAGGRVNWDQAPFEVEIESIQVSCYSGPGANNDTAEFDKASTDKNNSSGGGGNLLGGASSASWSLAAITFSAIGGILSLKSAF